VSKTPSLTKADKARLKRNAEERARYARVLAPFGVSGRSSNPRNPKPERTVCPRCGKRVLTAGAHTCRAAKEEVR
jgi:hypothetical protein